MCGIDTGGTPVTPRDVEFYSAHAPVPEQLRTDAFVLRPLRASDNSLDYEAVMATQEALRRLGEGDWPRPGFTPEENLADLERHEADFRDRRGFTYTVLDPEGTRCLGCVYVYPLVRALRGACVAGDEIARIGAHEAVAWFWMRPDAVAADLDRRLLEELLRWLRTDFAFSRVVFRTWEADERQAAMLRDAGLQLEWSHPEGDSIVMHFT
jgi:RimJ/RimL family protein N-acetyltransferase